MARKSKPRCVLVSRFSALGDVAMTIPVVYDVALTNPETRFVFLTRPRAAEFFVNPPRNLQVVGINTDDYKGIRGMARLASELRKEYSPDSMADLHDVLRTKLLRLFMRLHGVRTCKINKGRRGKRSLTRSRNKVLLPLVSTRARYREVFHHVGLSRDEHFRSLYDGATGPEALFASVTAPKQPDEKWLAIAPFAKHRGKIYPLGQMEQVVAAYKDRPRVRIFLFGAGDKENEVLSAWERKYPNVTNMAAHRLGMEAELSLLSHCDVMLSMDSANMHMASLVGLRVVSIWGATHPYCGFMGWRQDKRDAIQLDMVCRPCSVFGDKACRRGDYLCLTGITPQRIVNAIDI